MGLIPGSTWPEGGLDADEGSRGDGIVRSRRKERKLRILE
jgi:hypothetical protein